LARLHADENFPLPVVEALRRLGHDVLTAAEAGRAGLGIPDDEVLEFARGLGRAVLTYNRKDFRHLHADGRVHGGIIICTWDRDVEALAVRIDAALSATGDLAGALVRVNRPPPPPRRSPRAP
jgi:Domain of unknown function (DUF5615)